MRTEYPQPSRLSFNDAVNVWLRYWAGEFQHHIAASYCVNPGRVSEVLKRRKHVGSELEAALQRRASGLLETKESDLGFQFSHEYATVLHAHRCHI
jgi:hypothetical protein